MKKINSEIELKYSFIKILSGSDLSKRRLPYMMVKSKKQGPTLWLTGCMHGDEIGGTVIIHEIFKKLRSKLICGAVYAFPLINPMGFETASRNIILSKEDLNRSFPGDPKGSLAERIASIIFNFIKETEPVLVLDLHNDWNKSIPYVLLDPQEHSINQEVYQKNKEFASISGLLKVVDTEIIRTTLTYNLININVPSLTLEMGESFLINEKSIMNGVKAIWNILTYLKMIVSDEELFRYTVPEIIKNKTLQYSALPLSPRSGIIRFLKKPGDIIYKDQKIAKIYNAFGKNIKTINSTNNGIILGHSDYAVTYPGAPVMAFGVFD